MDVPIRLADLIHNDHGAWTEFFCQIKCAALAVAHARLGNVLPNEVEDMATVACVEIIQKVDTLESIEHARSLVGAICRSRCIDRIRRYFGPEGGSVTGSLDVDGEAHSVVGSDADTELRDREIASLVRSLINRLKPKMRQLLEGVFLKKLSYKELAKMLGIAEGSVGVYINRALQELEVEIDRVPGLRPEIRQLLDLGRIGIILLLGIV